MEESLPVVKDTHPKLKPGRFPSPSCLYSNVAIPELFPRPPMSRLQEVAKNTKNTEVDAGKRRNTVGDGTQGGSKRLVACT